LKKLNEKKRIETMVCFLPLTLVFARKPFSTLFKRKKEKEKVLWHICANPKSPPQNPY
jgi:hypothetical protein